MTKFVLLPGENIRWQIRPALTAGAKFHLASFGIIAIALAHLTLFTAYWWVGVERGPWWQFWTYLYGNEASAIAVVLLSWSIIGLIVGFLLHKWWQGLVGGAITAILVVIVAALLPLEYAFGLPISAGILAALNSIVAEVDLALRRIYFTDLRCVSAGGIWDRKERSVRYQDVADLDFYQDGWGKLFGYGSLVPVLAKHAKKKEADPIPRVGPLDAARDMLLGLVRRHTISKDLQKAGKTTQRFDNACRRLRAKQPRK